MNWKTVIAAGAVLLFAGIPYAQGAPATDATQAQPPGGHLNIVEVFVEFYVDVDSGLDILTIYGEDFDFGGPLVVTLGDEDISDFCTAHFEPLLQKIECDWFLEDGNYLLTVSTGTHLPSWRSGV